MNLILLIVALVCFILAALGVSAFGVALLPFGLAAWVAAEIFGGAGIVITRRVPPG